MMITVNYTIQHTPLGHKDQMGSKYNFNMFLKTGEVIYETLDWLAKYICIELAKYVIENNLLDMTSWIQFNQYARQQHIMEQLIKQATLRYFYLHPK